MVIYIHGFGGSGEGTKAKIFREYFKNIGQKFIAPSLSYVPVLAVKTLKEIINLCEDDVYCIGSSLGGYYASYLQKMPQVKKIVLINPAVNPISTLNKMTTKSKNIYDNSFFEWNEKHLNSLNNFNTITIEKNKYFILLQKDDELLDYQEAKKKYASAKLIIEDGGNHSFVGIERYLKEIRSFLV